MQGPTDPSLSRRLHEIEKDLRYHPVEALSNLRELEPTAEVDSKQLARVKLMQVQALIELDKLDVARRLLMDTRSLINSKKDDLLWAFFRGLLGQLKYRQCQVKDALSLLDESLNFLSHEPINPQVALTLLDLRATAIWASIDLGLYAQAVSHAQQNALLVQRFDISKGHVTTLYQLAEIYLCLNLLGPASEAALRALSVYSKHQHFDHSQLVLAKIHLRRGEIAECLDLCAESFVNAASPLLETRGRHLAGMALLRMEELEAAESQFVSALELTRRHQFIKEALEIKISLVETFRIKGDLDQAVELILESFAQPAVWEIAECKHRLLLEKAMVMQRLSRHQEASDTYQLLIDFAYDSQLREQYASLVSTVDTHTLHSILGLAPLIRQTPDSPLHVGSDSSVLFGIIDRLHGLDDLDLPQLRAEVTTLSSTLEALVRDSAKLATTESDGLLERNFKGALLAINPQFTSSELRVCSLIRDDKSSLQIAHLLGVSVRTIDTHRSRIRKKLGLDNAENLRSFLLRL